MFLCVCACLESVAKFDDSTIQWNPSNLDTIESFLISEVPLFHKHGIYLGRKKVSCLERCPHREVPPYYLSTAGGVGCHYMGGLMGNVQTSDARLELLLSTNAQFSHTQSHMTPQ